MKTYVLSWDLSNGETVNIVIKATGRNVAVRESIPLFWQLASGSSIVKRHVNCLG